MRLCAAAWDQRHPEGLTRHHVAEPVHRYLSILVAGQ